MTSTERFLLWVAVIFALVGTGFALYNFFAGRELTVWAKGLHHEWNSTVYEHGHGAGDHLQPPPPPPDW